MREDDCSLPREGHHGTIKKGSLYNNATMYARWEWNQALPKPYLCSSLSHELGDVLELSCSGGSRWGGNSTSIDSSIVAVALTASQSSRGLPRLCVLNPPCLFKEAASTMEVTCSSRSRRQRGPWRKRKKIRTLGHGGSKDGAERRRRTTDQVCLPRGCTPPRPERSPHLVTSFAIWR